MNNMGILLIYPFNVEVMPLLRSEKFLSAQNQIILCAFKGSGFGGKDAGVADGGDSIGIVVSENYEECLNVCTTVLFIESSNVFVYKDLIEKVERATKLGKTVIKTHDSFDYSSDVGLYNRYFYKRNINSTNLGNFVCSEILSQRGINDVTYPVIGVIGAGENTSKFQIQMFIYEALLNCGYKVTWIGSNRLCELVNANPFPYFMYSNAYNDNEKVILFNRYINYLGDKDNSDIILIGVPGGIMPCSKNIVGDFGTLAYKIFQSVTPDFLLMSIYYDDYLESYFNEMILHVKYKLGCDLDIINISNRRIDWVIEQRLTFNVIPFFLLDIKYVNNYICKINEVLDVPIVNILNEDELSIIVKKIINKLEDNEPNIMF